MDACGENRVQELVEKNGQGAYAGAPLHFIGHLQKNKIKYLVAWPTSSSPWTPRSCCG